MSDIKLTIPVPEDLPAALNESPEELSKEITLSAAMWLYITERLSLAKAASLAGYHRYDFETHLSKNKVPISLLSADDVFRDAKKIQS